MVLRSAIAHDGIPFEVKRQIPNATTGAALDEYEEMKKIQIITSVMNRLMKL